MVGFDSASDGSTLICHQSLITVKRDQSQMGEALNRRGLSFRPGDFKTFRLF